MIALWWKMFISDWEIAQDERSCINSIETNNPINGSDTVTIKMSDPNLRFISDNIYMDNVPVRFIWGIHDTLFARDFNGFISAIDIDFPEDGVPTMTLTVMDKSHIMNREKKKRSWENTTNSAVVQQIAKEYGFNCIVESGYSFKTEDTISQSSNTDLEFIEQLADGEDEPFFCKLIGDTIYYCKKGLLNDPRVSLKYKEYPYDLLSFSPQITIEDKQDEEESSDIDTDSVSEVSSSANEKTATRDVQGSSPKSSSSSSNNSSSNSGSSSSSSGGNTHTFDPKTQSWN